MPALWGGQSTWSRSPRLTRPPPSCHMPPGCGDTTAAPAGTQGSSLPLWYWMARAMTATLSSRARETVTAQSTSSSWLREARRLSSGPGPFRNPTWAGAGPAIAPRGDQTAPLPLPSPITPQCLARLHDEVGTRASICGTQGTSPSKPVVGAGSPPSCKEGQWSRHTLPHFGCLPARPWGQPRLAWLLALLLLPTRLQAGSG